MHIGKNSMEHHCKEMALLVNILSDVKESEGDTLNFSGLRAIWCLCLPLICYGLISFPYLHLGL